MKTKILLVAMISFLLLGNTAVLAEQDNGRFSDVPDGHWAESAIQWGIENKIVAGYGNGTFKPNAPVSYVEFLSMLFKAYGGVKKPTSEELNRFPDDLKGKWWVPIVVRSSELNYHRISVEGPETIMNRLYIAELITATQGVNLSSDSAIKYVLGNGYMSGKGGVPSINGFDAESNITRAVWCHKMSRQLFLNLKV